MSGGVTFWTGCSTKKRMYKSKSDAKKVRKDLRHRKQFSGKDAQGLSVYCCEVCYHWHIGHLPYHVRRGLGGRNG